jgi:hypothetical protein
MTKHDLTNGRSFKATTAWSALAGLVAASAIGAWAAAAQPAAQTPAKPVDTSAYEKKSTAAAPYVPIRVLDTEKMPIAGPMGAIGVGRKPLYESTIGGGHLRIWYTPPGGKGAGLHYHPGHEWAYNIQGDFVNNESTNPDNYSILQRFREGAFLSRPPYSLHGGEQGRMEAFMETQVGAVILLMEEMGSARGSSLTADPRTRDLPVAERGGGNPGWKDVKMWATPRIVDTIGGMPFQDVEGSPGLHAKYLAEDSLHGFRATIYRLDAGAATPARFRPHYYKQGYQFIFVINGDLMIDAYAGPGQKKESYRLIKHFYVERPPMSAMAIAPEKATEANVVWLEVTYGKGDKWSDTPIAAETPTYF